jgi:hypothetical protein
MNEFIEVQLTLDSHNLLQIEALIAARVKELQDLKNGSDVSIMAHLADEQIENYKLLSAKIADARKEVKRVKAEADAQYFASRK